MCGVTPSRDNSLIPLYASFIGLAVVAVILRLVARAVMQAYFWWDDLANLFAFVRAVPTPSSRLRDLADMIPDWLCCIHRHRHPL